MAEAKTKPTETSIAEYLAQITDEIRRQDCEKLIELMREATGEKAVLWGPSIVGFGRYAYRYESGRTGESMIIGFANRKTDLTLYLPYAVTRHGDLVTRLGKYKTGRSCLYIKRLSEIDIDVLQELIAASLRTFGEEQVAIPE